MLSRDDYDAVVFDLDGVLTQTARVHALAWKQTFDDFLRRRAGPEGIFEPFDAEADYLTYVDGKPRNDGVRSFLESREVTLPPGSDGDSPEKDTVRGLGNRKNRLFRRLLREEGVAVHDGARELLTALRNRGYLTAVVSSSKNCKAVTEAARLDSLFDARVDGVDLERFGLRGKPAADMFREAARRLEVEPARAAMLEDSLAGVEAGRAAGYRRVIGVSRGARPEALRKAGADVVITHLNEICPEAATPVSRRVARELPSALEELESFTGGPRRPVLFLDYDGTLTPIVDDPDAARLSEEVYSVLSALADNTLVAVISGRDLSDIERRVGVENIYYAGSHGFDIKGPQGTRVASEKGQEFLGELEKVEQYLRKAADKVPGARVEHKRFSVALHYRLVPDSELPEINRIAEQALELGEGLRRGRGKKVYEFQPDIEWDKGKAVRWLLEVLDLDTSRVLPVYIGDDETDEDAFVALEDDGLGIAVQERLSVTAARYRLRDPEEVRRFLGALNRALAGR